MTRAEAGLLIGGLATALLIGYAGIRRDRSVSPGRETRRLDLNPGSPWRPGWGATCSPGSDRCRP